MKIALNIEHLDTDRGGAERYVYLLAEEMTRRGHEVHIFSRDARISCPEGIILHIVPTIKWPRIISQISFIINSSREIKRIPFDIVHVFGKNIYMNVFQPLGGSHRASFIQNLCSIDNPLKKFLVFFISLINLKKLLFFYVERIQMKNKDNLRMIAISNMVKNTFIKYYSFPDNNIDVIYNGVDLERFHPRNKDIYRKEVRSSIGIGDDKVVLIFIANNFRLKGLHCAIRTIAGLRKKVGGGYFKLLVVGRGKGKRYIRLAKRLGCIGDIVFIGPQKNIERYLVASDICFQPTFYDPASMVVLEALASGVPLVTTRYSGMGEIITDGKEGFIVHSPRDVEELSKKIIFLGERGNLNKFSRADRELAERFPLQRNYQEVMAVYKKVVEPV